MRFALKHQIILAPVAVLLLLSLLLGFLQYSYWDLSVKRQEARKLGTVFIALAEADLASQRLHGLVRHITREGLTELRELDALEELYLHLFGAVTRLQDLMPIKEENRLALQQAVSDLNPERGFDPERYLAALNLLRPQLITLSEQLQDKRQQLRNMHGQDIDALVARTALVSLVVLGAAVGLGILLSLTFARRLLRRIQTLSDSAGRIADGELVPPEPPKKVRDELDALTLSINRMTDRLIRVVATEKLLEGAEEERRRIAMDIHDQTLADLSSVLRGLQDLKSREPCRKEALRLEEELQRAIGNLREVMDNLHPQTLEILGFEAALQSHLEKHLARGDLPEYHLYVSPEAETAGLSRLARLTLYRITLEAVHNVVKHARAGRLEITLERRGGFLVLSVEDNGIGFDPVQTAASTRSRGLNNIRERARTVGAEVEWGSSRFTSGTRFQLIIPVQTRTAAQEQAWTS